jgi:cyclopropane fatty-acyl-phospholipid synthase-like methyltransferase
MHDQFIRSKKYNRDWLLASISGAANPLWMTEWLCGALELQPGMRVLDLGCGKACSSIFLHKEFDVEVWAVDLWFSANQNLQRIRDAGVEKHVFPLRADARALPFAAEFFDVIVSIDSFCYYGTDDLYLRYLTRFLRPAGWLGIAGSGLAKEIEGPIPEHLQKWWTPDLNCLHSAAWWAKHWNRNSAVRVKLSDTMQEGGRVWLDWHRIIAPTNKSEIEALEADAGEYVTYVRTIAERVGDLDLSEPVQQVASSYERHPLFWTEK